MQFRISAQDSKYILHPLLLAFVFILNTIRGKLAFAPTSIQDTVVLSITILCLVFACYHVWLFGLKEKLKAAILTSVCLFFLLWYFDIYYLLFNISFIKKIVSEWLFQKFHVVLLCFLILLLFSVYFFLKKIKHNLLPFNNYLNILFFLYIFVELYKLSFYKKHDVDLLNSISALSIHPCNDPPKDIYYILMDSYTSTKSLKKYWNYDNNELTAFLKSKRFLITENSRCNYNSTLFSISAGLNMSYLNVRNYEEAQKTQASELFDLAQNSRVVRCLAENGYIIKNYSLFDILNTPAFYTDPFYHKTNLFDRTLFFLFTERLNYTQEHETLMGLGRINMNIISGISSLKDSSSPAFYYVHLMMPHYPYFFDEYGNKMPESYILSANNPEEKYLKQLKYTNHLIMQTIDTILARSKTQPVIILQGDHGFRELRNVNFEERLRESQTIFNAYFLPKDTLQQIVLHDSISPVNTFRIVFNNYFGTNLPMLEDRSYNTEIKE